MPTRDDKEFYSVHRDELSLRHTQPFDDAGRIVSTTGLICSVCGKLSAGEGVRVPGMLFVV